MGTRFGWIAGLAGVATLAACGDLELTDTATFRCPEILIPLNTERVTRFAPGTGRDITDVVLQAEVKFLSGECTLEEDVISMTFPVAVRGERGPAEQDGVEVMDVFLAVSTPDREILTRRELPMTLPFEGNRTTIVSSDVVTVNIPRDDQQTVDDFVVFLGLALSREELAYNRQEQRR